MDLLYSAKKVPNYLKRFGLTEGLRLFFQIELAAQNKAGDRHVVKSKRFDGPISLRRTRSDHSAFWYCLVAEQYSVDTFPQAERLNALYRDMLAKGQKPLIVDAGANIGMSTVWLAERYPEARIFAIEPDSANHDLLAANTAVYGERVTAFQGGIWPEAGRLEIENPDAGAQHFRTRETSGESASGVEAVTVPDILERTGTDAILYMKVDIEGAQKELFSRNTDWVAKAHLISIELDDWLLPWAGTSRPFLACLNGYKFDYLLQGENLVCFQDTSEQS